MDKLIDPETKESLSEKFKNMLNLPVDVKIFTNPVILPGSEDVTEYNLFAKQFIKELSEIDARILYQEISVSDNIVKELNIKTSPTLAIGYDLGYKILFNGAPAGYEANSVIETILLVSAQQSLLSKNSKNLLNILTNPVNLKVFVTPTCPYCPSAVILANQIAIEKKGIITSECVESSQNSELAMKFGVSSVPHTFINDDVNKGILGSVDEKIFIDFLMQNINNKN